MTEVGFGEYLLGSIELALIAAALGLGAWRLRALLLPGWAGASARLVEAVLALSGLVIVLELVGVVGLYRPGWVLAATVATGLGAAWLATRRLAARGDDGRAADTDAPHVPAAMVAIATGAALLVAAHWAVPTQEALDIGMYKPNSTWHNMPFAARFVQEAQVGALHFTEPLRLTVWYYPQNSELLHSSGILFLGSDFLSPIINLGWLALCMLAAWSFGRPYAVGAATLIGVALVLNSDMLLLYQPGDAKNDVAGLFGLLAAAAILVNAEARRRGVGAGTAKKAETSLPALPTATIVVAGLAAGLALGTKLNLLAPVGALTIGIVAIAPAGTRIKRAAIWSGSMLATGGFWFARNLVESGSPLPWVKKLGPIDLPNPDQLDIDIREPHTITDYITNGEVIKDWFIPGLHDSFGPVWPALLAVMLGGIVLAIWRGSTPVIRMLGFVAGFAALAYLFTPLTAAGKEGMPDAFVVNLRYLSPALAIGAMLFAVDPALRRGRPGQVTVIGLAALLLISALPSDVWDADRLDGAVLFALLLIGVPAGIVLLARRGIPAIALVLTAVAALGIAIGIGWRQQDDYLDERYSSRTAPSEFPTGVLAAMRWTKQADLHDQRIAVVGARAGYKQYVFYGDDLSNHVQYVGEHGTHGAFRPIESCERWREELNEGDYDYLVASPAHLSQDTSPIEAVWTTDPATRRLQEEDLTFVFEINGELDPAACGAVEERAGEESEVPPPADRGKQAAGAPR